MTIKCFALKRPSINSKGIACLRFNGCDEEKYSRTLLTQLKREWHFFWFSSWRCRLKDIPYQDLIDIWVVWDDLIRELAASRASTHVAIRGGCETAERHDLLAHPLQGIEPEIDILYIARFFPQKRPDVAVQCVRYIADRYPSVRAVFLESPASDYAVRMQVVSQIKKYGLESNVTIKTVPVAQVNWYLNRSRLSLFTSDIEGICRAVLQSLLAERPLLCYRYTEAITRELYDDRYFHYYDEQTANAIGAAACKVLEKAATNPGARNYVLAEKRIRFHNVAEWQAEILEAARPLYLRDGQCIESNDIVAESELRRPSHFWQEFVMEQ
jgi:glycosyltransferase involved in cell wall biosynthesis